MLRNLLAVVVGLTSFAVVAAPLSAQEPRVRRVPTLSQRLESFRQDLLGGDDSPEQPQAKSRDNRNQDSRNQESKPASPPPRVGSRSPFTKPGGEQTITPTTRRPAGSQPEYQVARRAQPPKSEEPEEQETDPSEETTGESSEASADGPTVAERLRDAKNESKKESSKSESLTPAVVEQAAPRTARVEKRDVKPSVEEAPAEKPEPVETKSPEASIARPTVTPSPSIDRIKRENVLFAGQSPLISVEATGPKKVLLGKEATFTVVVRNSGSAGASNVTVTLNVPPYAEVVSAQPTTGSTRTPGPDADSSHTGGEPLEWKLARLESHGKETLTLKLIPRKSLPLDLAVQWTCSPETTQTLVEVQEPKLLLALSGPEEVLYGQSKIYKLTLSNPGNGDAEGVSVSLMPIGRITDAPATHKLGTLRAGESKAIEVELTARQAGALTIKAQAFADGGLRSDVSQNVLVRRANLKVEVAGSKVKYAGTPAVYQVRVTNDGTASAESTQLSAILPPEAKYISSNGGGRYDAQQGKVTWTVATLPPGGEKVYELQCTLQAAGENRMQTIALAEGDLSASTTTTTRVEALADLKLEVRDPQGAVAAGDDAVYEVIIRNRGTKAAEGIELVMFFSDGLEAMTVQGGAHEITQGQVICKPIMSLAAGSESIFRVSMKAGSGGQHVFRAEVACQSPKTKIACEETTLFYDDSSAGSSVSESVTAEPGVDELGQQ